MSDLDHIKEIETVASDDGSERDPVVLDSWLRCFIEDYLHASKPQEAYIVPDSKLREHRQESEELIFTMARTQHLQRCKPA